MNKRIPHHLPSMHCWTLSCMATSARAAAFVWTSSDFGGDWELPANWNDGSGPAPSGTDISDVLVFGGGPGPSYVSANNLPIVPSLFNQLVFTAPAGGTGNFSRIEGAQIALGGTAPRCAVILGQAAERHPY